MKQESSFVVIVGVCWTYFCLLFFLPYPLAFIFRFILTAFGPCLWLSLSPMGLLYRGKSEYLCLLATNLQYFGFPRRLLRRLTKLGYFKRNLFHMYVCTMVIIHCAYIVNRVSISLSYVMVYNFVIEKIKQFNKTHFCCNLRRTVVKVTVYVYNNNYSF